ncbi:RING-type domain-containing protein [Forsythia ovata]|uniref:RING-type domain-containing protein n=1 Tax=Forsythia ovata TaxID=205694 RepID=A0ABD1QQP1_9LAMI
MAFSHTIIPLTFLVNLFILDIKINYILKKRPIPGQDDDEEILDSICRTFPRPWYFVTYPQNNLDRWFRYHGLRYDDAREGLQRQIIDFASQMKADPSNAGHRSFPLLVSIQVYTVQQEDETIDAAKDRAIIVETFGGIDYERSLLFRSTATLGSEKPEYLEKVNKVKVDNPEQEECCICLNKPCVGEEILILPCLHTYHSKCIFDWLMKSKLCPLCRKPMH